MPKNSNREILVTGATGRQGGAVLRKLHERGFPVRALTRDPSSEKARHLVGHGTEVVKGDFEDPASLTRALDGVYGVFSVQTLSVDDEVRQGIALADAAKRSHVSHFVYSSGIGADRNTGIPRIESKGKIEQHLRGTGLPFTILRPGFFMENLLFMRDQIEQGELVCPVNPESKLALIAIEDIGGFAAAAFEKPGHWLGQTREIAGEELSLSDIADRLGRISGREVRYRQLPWDEWERTRGSEMTVMWHWLEDSAPHIETGQVRQEYPQLTGFDRWLGQHWVMRRTA